MTTPHRTLQMALDALENSYLSDEHRNYELQAKAIAALREALAAPEPEPVMEFKGRRLTPEGTRECWGMLLCKPEQDPARGALLYAAPPAAPAPAAPVVREPVIDEMDAVASKYAHKMALDLECVLSDYSGKWWDAAMQTLGEYRSAMNAIHERESPRHMGEPVLPQHGITGGSNG